MEELDRHTITLVPVGGLANRMKAIASAIALAEDTGHDLQIIWFRDPGLNCPFARLFTLGQLPGQVKIALREATLSDKLFNDRPRKRNFYLPRITHPLRYGHVMYEEEATRCLHEHFDFVHWCRRQDVYLAACVAFHPYKDEFPFACFRPTEPLQEQIRQVTAGFNAHTLGVHLRRTDNAASIRQSPTELFEQRMQQEIDLHPDARFYVATDSEEDKQRLVRRFGTRILTSAQPADRNSIAGISEALVEMYALSHTCRILGSAHSTFSEIAARIGGIVCETLIRPS